MWDVNPCVAEPHAGERGGEGHVGPGRLVVDVAGVTRVIDRQRLHLARVGAPPVAHRLALGHRLPHRGAEDQRVARLALYHAEAERLRAWLEAVA